MHGTRRWSYAEVDAQSAGLAASLAGLGVRPGDRLAVDLPNWPEWVVAFLAGARLGATVVPLDPGLSFHELKYQLRHSEARAVVTPEVWNGTDYLELYEEMLGELPDLRHVVTVGPEDLWTDDRFLQFEDLVVEGAEGLDPGVRRGDGDSRAAASAADDSPLALLYTSGTMGKPKGVLLSHRNLVETARAERRGAGAPRRGARAGGGAVLPRVRRVHGGERRSRSAAPWCCRSGSSRRERWSSWNGSGSPSATACRRCSSS